MESIQNNWKKTLDLLRGDLNPTAYESFIEPLVPQALDQSVLILGTEDQMILGVISNRYRQIIEAAATVAFGFNVSIRMELLEPKQDEQCEIPGTEPIPEAEDSFAPITNEELVQEKYLNPKYTFDNFVVGKSNEYAHAAAMAVANSASAKGRGRSQYQVLFLYGGAGLGKTHLMHAIGRYILANNKRKKVLYVTAETFTQELISAIGHQKLMPAFKKKYRKVDALLIDDIQFLEGKERTQEEFFHTFDELYTSDKLIVISSDRAPEKLETLDDRLTSRFMWNLKADIQKPDYETRIAILKRSAIFNNVEITPEVQSVIELIAEKITSNIREMEGSLMSILSYSTLLGRPISLSVAREALKESMESTPVTVDSIKRCVAKTYNITLKDMDSSKRARSVAFPRQIAMYLTKNLTDMSYPKIGEAFGGRDHTTVLYACNKMRDELQLNKDLEREIEAIKSQLI